MTRWQRTNFRGRPVSLIGGPVAMAVVAVVAAPTDRPTLVAALGAGAVGLYDDLYGDPGTKGLAGHLRALARGHVTSGALKILGVGASALAAALLLDGLTLRALATAALVAGTANLLNLFDLRPGRALKVAVLAAAPLRAWGVLAAAAVLLWPDLRERSMLGDAGANALGAAIGVRLAGTGLPGLALLVVVVLTLASERVSFSRVIDRTPPLRWFDRLGRLA